MLNIKVEHHISERAFDAIAKLMKEVVPKRILSLKAVMKQSVWFGA